MATPIQSPANCEVRSVTYLNINHLNSTRFMTIRFATKYSRT